MPLFMDFHKVANVTVEDVVTAHTADVAIQDQYGVKYHQFWVNEGEGTIFCLVEGPDAATCEKVHQMAHGNLACALTEVTPGFYEQLMGKPYRLDHGLVRRNDGTADAGYRTILAVAVYSTAIGAGALEVMPAWAKKEAAASFVQHSGRLLTWESGIGMMAVFDDAAQAMHCAAAIQKSLSEKDPTALCKMGISAAQPVTQDGDFFNEAIHLAKLLSIAQPGSGIWATSLVKKLCGDNGLLTDDNSITTLSSKDETFLTRLTAIAETHLTNPQYDLDHLSQEMCISRPQLYRRVAALTGKSPHEFMHHLRMHKALTMLLQQPKGIAEVAYELCFSSPSYFTKCFTQQFGCPPSALVKGNAA